MIICGVEDTYKIHNQKWVSILCKVHEWSIGKKETEHYKQAIHIRGKHNTHEKCTTSLVMRDKLWQWGVEKQKT